MSGFVRLIRRRVALVMAATIFVLTAFAGVVPARAQSDEAEGRRRFKRGQEFYVDGRFLEAAKEFEAGFAATPRPLFLLNIGHSYRRARELAKAKESYQKLLQLLPDLPQREEIQSFIRSIDDVLQAPDPTETAKGRGAESSRPPRGPGSAPDLAAISPKPLPSDLAEPMHIASERSPSDGASSSSVYRQTWFWMVVGAVVAGGATALVLTYKSQSSCMATACFKEQP